MRAAPPSAPPPRQRPRRRRSSRAEAACSSRTAAPAQRPAGGRVAEAGDVRLVTHHPHELHPLARGDRPRERQRLLGRVHWRALGADASAPARERKAGVELQAHAHRRGSRPDGGIQQVELLNAVHHHAHLRLGALGRQPRERTQRRAIDRRIRHHDVPQAPLREPQRLGQREGKRAGKARAQKHAFLQSAAAHGLAGQADRLGRGAPFHVGGVRPEGVDIDQREGRLKLRGSPLVAPKIVGRTHP